VTAVIDAADAELRALQVALHLAGEQPLTVLLTGAQAAREARRAQVERVLAAGGAKLRIELAPEAAVPHLARARPARIVVVSGAMLRADRAVLAALLDAILAPVMLVG
jgi:hypothetical protein